MIYWRDIAHGGGFPYHERSFLTLRGSLWLFSYGWNWTSKDFHVTTYLDAVGAGTGVSVCGHKYYSAQRRFPSFELPKNWVVV